MTTKTVDKSTSRVTRLVWLMAVLGVVTGAVVLSDISLRLRSVRLHREITEQARTDVSTTLDNLRSYRVNLLQQLDTLQLLMFGRSLATIEEFPELPLQFDQARVDAGAAVLETSIQELGGSRFAALGTTEALVYGLEQTHASLQEVWQGTTSAQELLQQCATVQHQVRGDLERLSAIVARAVGLNRLQVARQLASARQAEDGDRLQQLEELVSGFRGVQQPSQVDDDLRELALDTERLFGIEDVDALRSYKDNRIRQTLSRLRRNSDRLGEDAARFNEELDNYQTHLFGADSKDDKQYQMLMTTDDGLYEKKVRLIERLRLLRTEAERAEQAARACQSAEREVNRTVAARYTDAVHVDDELMKNASHALYVLAGAASVMFLAGSWWIAGLVSRAMQESQERLRESMEMARIIRESPIEVYICNRDSLKFVEVNHGACQNLGYTREEMLEKTPIDVSSHQDLRILKEKVSQLDTGDINQMEFHTAHHRKDGSTYPVQVILHPAYYHDQPVYVAFVTDLTQVKQLEQQLAQAQKLESIGQLAAGLAHEINTPMQFVADNIEFVESAIQRLMEVSRVYQQVLFSKDEMTWEDRQKMIADAAQLHEFEYHCQESVAAVQETREGVHRVVEIARAMKEFSHPGAKEKTYTNINDIIQSTATISRNRWKYVADLNLDLEPNLPLVPVLVSELNQVLLNLMVNASDAIAERFDGEADGLGAITIRSRCENEAVIVAVEDNGGGIPQEIQDSIFDPFFTTKEVGKGTGQGLSICRSVVVNLHGGRIRVESEPGVGTVFTIWLPIHAPETEDPLKQVAPAVDDSELAEVCS